MLLLGPTFATICLCFMKVPHQTRTQPRVKLGSLHAVGSLLPLLETKAKATSEFLAVKKQTMRHQTKGAGWFSFVLLGFSWNGCVLWLEQLLAMNSLYLLSRGRQRGDTTCLFIMKKWFLFMHSRLPQPCRGEQGGGGGGGWGGCWICAWDYWRGKNIQFRSLWASLEIELMMMTIRMVDEWQKEVWDNRGCCICFFNFWFPATLHTPVCCLSVISSALQNELNISCVAPLLLRLQY